MFCIGDTLKNTMKPKESITLKMNIFSNETAIKNLKVRTGLLLYIQANVSRVVANQFNRLDISE